MRIKNADDYIEELSELFPQIEEKEIKRIVHVGLRIVLQMVRRGYGGFTLGSGDSIHGLKGRFTFLITNIYSKGFKFLLMAKRKGLRRYKESLENGEKAKQ